MNRSFDGICKTLKFFTQILIFSVASANRANSLHQNGASSSSNPGSEQRVYPVEIKRQSHSNLWPTGNENGVNFYSFYNRIFYSECFFFEKLAYFP